MDSLKFVSQNQNLISKRGTKLTRPTVLAEMIVGN